MSAKIVIEYCPKCKWLARAVWMQQELLTTFEEELEEVALRPSRVSGEYNILLNGKIIFSRNAMARFPEIKELKKIVRDVIAPDKSLGHAEH